MYSEFLFKSLESGIKNGTFLEFHTLTDKWLVLAKDKDKDVRRNAASALGSAFLQLIVLTKDKDNDIGEI